jgi:hypothetical protein
MATQLLPPSEVNLIYRNVGRTHVFTAMELPGFHIGSSKLDYAFNKAAEALNEHVSKLYKCDATYQLEYDFESFLAQIDSSNGPLVIARREQAVREAHTH